jgi:hypothetical protein
VSSDRWKMVKGLFQRALQLPPSEWEDYLTRVCAGDHELKDRVAELLREHRGSSGILGLPVFGQHLDGETYDPGRPIRAQVSPASR